VGRHAKVVTAPDDLDRRELGYYSTPKLVADFIAERIFELRPDAKRVFDPCIGHGELTRPFKARGCHVSGYDIVNMSPAGCDEFQNGDFLEASIQVDAVPLFHRPLHCDIDAIVANPPYNCHEVDYIRTHKAKLIDRFGKAAVLNMYALFIRAILDYAPDGCMIGLVTHDSFLTANGHQELRRYIVSNCTIHNLHLCPTNLFLDQGADVRTCLLVLEKGRRSAVMQSSKMQVSNRPATAPEFEKVLRTRSFQECELRHLLLGDDRDNCEFAIGVPLEVRQLFGGRRLAEIAPCLTGISTGNDKKYIRLTRSPDFNVPFYKNPASRRFFAKPDGYLCSNYEIVADEVRNFMIRNKTLMFREGISCSSMGVQFGATLRPDNTACGVNPNIIIEDDRKWWLLSYLNSKLCLYLTRGVVIRSNMITAGYASRIPVPEMTKKSLSRLAQLGQEGFARAKLGRSVQAVTDAIDVTVKSELGLSESTNRLLDQFECDPIRLA